MAIPRHKEGKGWLERAGADGGAGTRLLVCLRVLSRRGPHRASGAVPGDTVMRGGPEGEAQTPGSGCLWKAPEAGKAGPVWVLLGKCLWLCPEGPQGSRGPHFEN